MTPRGGPVTLLAVLAAALAAAAAALCATGAAGGCRTATQLGYEGLYFLLGIAVYTLLDGRLGAVGVTSAALAASSTVLLKHLLQLPRPPGAYAAGATGPGFPSGHTAVATGFWLAMAAWSRSPALAASATALAAVVAYTRIALSAHYLHDVAGGLLVGAASAVTVAALARRDGVVASVLYTAPAAGLAAALAAAIAPEYRAAWRLAGIDAGLYAAAAWLTAGHLEHCLWEEMPVAQRLAALAVPLAALAAASLAEKTLGHLGSLLGFALFAALALASRPLLCRTATERRHVYRPT